jgi:hypothetical protein
MLPVLLFLRVGNWNWYGMTRTTKHLFNDDTCLQLIQLHQDNQAAGPFLQVDSLSPIEPYCKNSRAASPFSSQKWALGKNP